MSGFDANDFELHRRRLRSIVLQRQRHIRRWRWHPVLRRHNRLRAGDALSGRHERAGDHDRLHAQGLASQRECVRGLEIDTVTGTDLTLTGDIIAENQRDGVGIFCSVLTDFVIQNSYLGAAPNPLGGSFAGNGRSGFHSQDTIFNGVAFLNSFFNGNMGIGIPASPGGDGIRFVRDTINSATVSLEDPNMTLVTGFTLKNSQVVDNLNNGVNFDGVTATSVTFNNATIAENAADGVFIHDSNTMDAFASSFTDFAIQNSYLGAAPKSMGGTFAGNGDDGFFGGNTTFTGVASSIRSSMPMAATASTSLTARSSRAWRRRMPPRRSPPASP